MIISALEEPFTVLCRKRSAPCRPRGDHHRPRCGGALHHTTPEEAIIVPATEEPLITPLWRSASPCRLRGAYCRAAPEEPLIIVLPRRSPSSSCCAGGAH